MAQKEQTERNLSERVVREAVEKGMETSLREPILEAVEAADGHPSRAKRAPLVGGLIAVSGAIGYLLGKKETEPLASVETIADSADESGPVSEAISELSNGVSEVESSEDGLQDSDGEETESSGRLRKLLLAAGIVTAIAVARRRFRSEEDEWEPVDEFDTAVEEGSTDDEDPEADTDEEDAESEEAEQVATEGEDGASEHGDDSEEESS